MGKDEWLVSFRDMVIPDHMEGDMTRNEQLQGILQDGFYGEIRSVCGLAFMTEAEIYEEVKWWDICSESWRGQW